MKANKLVSSSAPRWQIDPESGISWDIRNDNSRPHEDHLEMSGQRVSLVLRYRVDADGCLQVTRKLIWPTLRLDATGVRSYLTRLFSDSDTAFRLTVNGEPKEVTKVARIHFDGIFHAHYESLAGLAIERSIFPSTRQAAAYEIWSFKNESPQSLRVEGRYASRTDEDSGIYGEYTVRAGLEGLSILILQPGESGSIALSFHALIASQAEKEALFPAHKSLTERVDSISRKSSHLRLETPESMFNIAVDFCKSRATESVFDTKRGLMHSPGGNCYYGGIWANDQGEYAAPLFPLLNVDIANESMLNCYRIFARYANPDYKALPSSFEMEGDVITYNFGDRGDAAMLAHGMGRFVLSLGVRSVAKELWPFVEWCLEYCRRKLTPEGVVASDTDEHEGRFPTGNANLHTSVLYYDALLSASRLALDLDDDEKKSTAFNGHAEELAASIEAYFGAELHGFSTYRYYKENTTLRAWIGSPLTVGLSRRASGTVAALFSPFLWPENSLVTEEGKSDYWDRETLYALRGAFVVGATDRALERLAIYTRERLLGEHVPYPVEAYPEGMGAHLAAESAMYVRIFTEGLFGYRPLGLNKFSWLPRLPKGWPSMALRSIRAHQGDFDLEVERVSDGLRCRVSVGSKLLAEQVISEADESPIIVSISCS